MVTRRTFMTVGGSVVALTALSGCLEGNGSADEPTDDTVTPDEDGDDDENGQTDDDGPDSEEYPFDADQFVYTTERTRRYGEFSEQPDDTYRDGEMVWVYIEVSNVTPVPGGPHLDTAWEVVGPNGDVLESTEETVQIPEESLGELPNEAFVTQSFDTTVIDTPTSGEYEMLVTITDRRSDETVEISRPFTLEQFEFDSAVFTDGQPGGFEEYDEQPDATYAVGDRVWLYLGIRNVPVDSDGTATLEYTFEVNPPDENEWEPIEITEQWQRVQPDEILVIWESFSTYEDDPTGEYEITITVAEKAHGEQLRTTEIFTLE